MIKSFTDIDNVAELVCYLKSGTRLNGINFLSKYTKISSVKELFETKLLLINNPRNMNDLYEYHSFSKDTPWDRICFHSFIADAKESMAMWSMYAQPWDEGVMITVPTRAIKQILRESPCFVQATFSEEKKRYRAGERFELSAKRISLTKVAYYSGTAITCNDPNNRNLHFSSPYNLSELAGYIKDSAWEYEKEVRLRVDLPDSYMSDAVFIEVTDDFLKQVRIITGPRFEGNVLRVLPERLRAEIEIESSRFTERIARIPCDDCKHKTQA